MFIKVFLLFVFLYNNYLFAESYIQNLEIINDNGMPIHYHVEVAKTYEEQKWALCTEKNLKKIQECFFYLIMKKSFILDEKYIYSVRYYIYK